MFVNLKKCVELTQSQGSSALMLESPTIHRVDSYQRSILNGLAKVERMMTQYYGQEHKPVAAVLVSEGDLSVCKRGAVSTSNTGLTEYLDYVDLSIALRPFTACTRGSEFHDAQRGSPTR